MNTQQIERYRDARAALLSLATEMRAHASDGDIAGYFLGAATHILISTMGLPETVKHLQGFVDGMRDIEQKNPAN